jgi:hypothetical protein
LSVSIGGKMFDGISKRSEGQAALRDIELSQQQLKDEYRMSRTE